MMDTDQTVEGYIREWTPARRPVHCSNCAECRITTGIFGVMAQCAKGYGEEKPISIVIRLENPRGWRDANKCPSFRSMNDDTD